MPPSNSLTITRAPVNGGVDWLSVCVFGTWPEDAWTKVIPWINAAKERAAKSKNSEGEFLLAPTGDDMLVRPYSVKHGVVYRWQFRWRGCDFALVNSRHSTGYKPLIFVTIPSRVLLAVDWWSAWLEVRELLDLLGFKYGSSIVSRVDVCVDMPGQSVQPFADAYREERFITRARTRSGFGKSPNSDTGLQLGRGDIVLRIYDKALECKHDEEKRELMIAGRWNGEECETAARVEFQVRRKVLKQLGLRSVEQLQSMLPFIVGYCCEIWCRVADSDVDRENNNQSRASFAPLWEQVCEEFRAWSFYTEPGRRERRKVQLEARPLIRQAIGCLSSALAATDKPIETADDVKRAIAAAFELDHLELIQKTKEKRRLLNVNSGARIEPPADTSL